MLRGNDPMLNAAAEELERKGAVERYHVCLSGFEWWSLIARRGLKEKLAEEILKRLKLSKTTSIGDIVHAMLNVSQTTVAAAAEATLFDGQTASEFCRERYIRSVESIEQAAA